MCDKMNEYRPQRARYSSSKVEPQPNLKGTTMKSETKVTSLVDMVNYEDQSVVSKTVIEKKTGTVTLFAFDQGQGLSEHTAPFDALVYVMEGEVEITVSGKPYPLERGEMIIMPADEPHALRAVKRFKMMLTMIKS